jgi:hypothetical protein
LEISGCDTPPLDLATAAISGDFPAPTLARTTFVPLSANSSPTATPPLSVQRAAAGPPSKAGGEQHAPAPRKPRTLTLSSPEILTEVGEDEGWEKIGVKKKLCEVL